MNDEQRAEPAETTRSSRAGLARLQAALRYSLAGLAGAYRNETAFRQEVLLAAVLLPLALLLPATATQKALLCGAVLLVLAVELLNSAIEATVDRVSLQVHELAKRAKDLGSAAVLVSLVNCVLVWGLVCYELWA